MDYRSRDVSRVKLDRFDVFPLRIQASCQMRAAIKLMSQTDSLGLCIKQVALVDNHDLIWCDFPRMISLVVKFILVHWTG